MERDAVEWDKREGKISFQQKNQRSLSENRTFNYNKKSTADKVK